MERRQRRLNVQKPKQFRDLPPQPLPPALECPQPAPTSAPYSSQPSDSTASSTVLRIRKFFKTSHNIFGVFRQYYSDKLPSHDPEEHIDLQDLSDGPTLDATGSTINLSQSGNLFHPFPNRNSFLLGDWQWNHGNQKSRQSFSHLLSIVGSSDFKPDDVRNTRWEKIHAALAANKFDIKSVADGVDAEWMDVDAGWKKSSFKISVPFCSRAMKGSNPQDDLQFHYEPFELFWKQPNRNDDIRLHGELYTSPAFLDAYRKVQGLPGEPGCDFPRVVAAMMFWSDATHLTSFGNAKLWPCYLYFGNESKYRRGKPSCHLCNHVAYFETVPIPLLLHMLLY